MVFDYSDNLSEFRQNVDCIIRQNDDTTTTRVRDTNTTQHTTQGTRQ